EKVSIIGAARSGIGAAKLLNNKGYRVFLSDETDETKINPFFVNELKENGITHEFGMHSPNVYEADLMVVSPGVPQNSTVIQTALKKGIEVVSEVEAASWFCKGKIIAITGTNGKTTTTTLIGEIFKDAGFETFVCGNIGTAFSEVVEKTNDDTITVLEISSFQLDNIKNFKPFVAIMLNITSDHLDRYESLEKYKESKMRLTENQNEKDHLIINYDDELLRNSEKNGPKAVKSLFSLSSKVKEKAESGAFISNNDLIYFYYKGEEKILNVKELILKGEHNLYNAMASVISARIFDIEPVKIMSTLVNFKGVEHRLEFVRELNGVKFYNDSKATNVNSVWYALRGFSEPIVLILGGKDKGNNYEEIKNEVKEHVKHIIAIGESKQKIYNFFKDKVPVTLAESMEDAVKKAAGAALINDAVLLSPACASFDMFENYEYRGREFKKIVNSL